MELAELIRLARGQQPADLLLRNARVVNVTSAEVHETDVAIAGSQIIGFGDYQASEVVDLHGAYLAPGFIDGHVHIESTMMTVPEFARTVSPRGTTTVVIDPHEIANVLGLDGIRYMLETSKHNPLSVYVMVPSCVPSTSLETAGSALLWYDLAVFLNDPWVLGLGEMMNYPGVLNGDQTVLDKLRAAHGRRIDGHAPGLTGRDLSAYVAVGIRSDHECTTIEEAREKLRQGMYVMIREGSTARNMAALAPLVTPENSRRCMFVTDDRHPGDLIDEGHMDFLVKKAISLGISPITAIQMVTLNPAQYFGLQDKGAIVPGFQADLVVFDDLEHLHVRQVYRAGKLVAENGEMLAPSPPPRNIPIRSSININWEAVSWTIPCEGTRMRVIDLVPDQIVTVSAEVEPRAIDGAAVADPDRDLLKLAVIERHLASGTMGKAFVRGFGLKRGAIASSVAHDSHNIVVVGVSDQDMERAVREIAGMRGGLAIVDGGHVLGRLPLPIAGLMSDHDVEDVSAALAHLIEVAESLGCTVRDPFMALSFLALPVIPEIKMTDRGLVDVTRMSLVPLFLP